MPSHDGLGGSALCGLELGGRSIGPGLRACLLVYKFRSSSGGDAGLVEGGSWMKGEGG